MTWNGETVSGKWREPRARLLIPVSASSPRNPAGNICPRNSVRKRSFQSTRVTVLSLSLFFFIPSIDFLSKKLGKTFPRVSQRSNIFFFFFLNSKIRSSLEDPKDRRKDKREKRGEVSRGKETSAPQSRRLSIISTGRKRGNVEWHPIEARAVARRPLRDSRALELIRVPWHTSGQIKFRF